MWARLLQEEVELRVGRRVDRDLKQRRKDVVQQLLKILDDALRLVDVVQARHLQRPCLTLPAQEYLGATSSARSGEAHRLVQTSVSHRGSSIVCVHMSFRRHAPVACARVCGAASC